jgi:hypothetical protein
MIIKINKERQRSMNTTPTRSSIKSKWQGAEEDPQTKNGHGTRQSMGRLITKTIHKKK